jgi:ribonuclease P protein component
MSRSPGALAFPRRERLRQSAEIQALFKRGNRVERPAFVALWHPDGARKVGFAVSRQVRTAVARNRVRRRLREAYRQGRPTFPKEIAIVFVGRPAALTADWERLLEDMAAVQSAVTRRVPSEPRRRGGGEPR